MFYKVTTIFNQSKNFYGMKLKGDEVVFDDVEQLEIFINGGKAYNALDFCVSLKAYEKVDTLYIVKDWCTVFKLNK